MNLKTLAVGLGLATAVSGGVVSCTQKDDVLKDKIEYVLDDIVNNKSLETDKFTKPEHDSAKLDNLLNEIKEGNLPMNKDGNIYDRIMSTLVGHEVVFRHGDYVTPSEAKWIDVKDTIEALANSNPPLAALVTLTGVLAAAGLTNDAIEKVVDFVSKKTTKEA